MVRKSKNSKVCTVLCKSGAFCSALEDSEINRLMAQSRQAAMVRGNVLAFKKLQYFPILCISEGIVALRHTRSDGRASISTFFFTGDIVDLRGAPQEMLGALTALSSTRFCQIRAGLFDKIIEANPQAQKIAWRSLRKQAHRVISQRAEMSKRSSVERLAWFVAEFSTSFQHGASGPRTSTFKMPFRHCDLAEFLGQQPETVSRGFSQLSAKGILRFDGPSRIKIMKPRALELLAYGRGPPMPRRAASGMKILRSI